MRAALAAAVLAGSALLLVPVHPAMLARAPGWVTMDVGGDRLLVPPNMAKRLRVVAARLEGRAPGSGDVLVAPHWVTMYAVHRLRSPVWEIYGLFPRGPRFEAAEIARMEAAGVDLAIIQTHALDGRDALLYRNTHPLTWRWLQRRFRRVDSDAGVETWVRRDRVATAEAAR